MNQIIILTSKDVIIYELINFARQKFTHIY